MPTHKDPALPKVESSDINAPEDTVTAADTASAAEATPDAQQPPVDSGEEATLKQILEAVKHSELTAHELLQAVKHSELTAEEVLEAVKTRHIASSATDGMLGPNPFVGFSREDVSAAAKTITRLVIKKPVVTIKHIANFIKEEARVLAGKSELIADKEDRRFADPTWSENPLYKRGLQTYLAAHKELNEWVDSIDLKHQDAERVRFVLSLVTEGLAPSNWIFNPAALKRLLETGGASAIHGIRHFIDDLKHNGGMPSLAKRDAFKVGKDLANTPGAVVFRNEVCELIQYTPRTEKVYRRPFLMVPPEINKFYLYDLSPKKSFIRYGLDNGLQMFAISWRNPTAAQRDWNLDTYVQAVEEAIDVTRAITASEDCNLLGGCAGGITTVSLVGHLASRGERKVNALILMVTLLDMSAETQLGLFATETTIEAAKRHSAKQGVLEGGEMARVFAWLRPNDLIWNYWVNNYLLGNEPPAFDVLAWNADTTRLPAAFHGDLLDVIKDNSLVKGKLVVRGTPIDLSKITCDLFWVAGITDHITPWQACYRSSKFLGGQCEFVLSTGGHIQSMLSAPGHPKTSFYTNSQHPAEPEIWLGGATEQTGSWWEHWRTWIKKRSGTTKKAPAALGNSDYPPLQEAPGTYIYE